MIKITNKNQGDLMSAFLGPIHYWMYNKIKYHEALLDRIVASLLEKGVDVEDMISHANTRFGAPVIGELSDVITHANIHGWLQERVTSVESRIAFVVTSSLGNDKISLDDLEKVFERYGADTAKDYIEIGTDAEGLFKSLNNVLLEGMPCDSINKPAHRDEKSFGWIRTRCLHKEYWGSVDGDVESYYRLRDALIKGFVSSFGNAFEFKVLDDGTNLISEVVT
ncbi:MAG: hypothetical protein Q8S24_11250 [Eubacteriales bacterium]|nr:hypothetical protein [Eubacteriales bacterium]